MAATRLRGTISAFVRGTLEFDALVEDVGMLVYESPELAGVARSEIDELYIAGELSTSQYSQLKNAVESRSRDPATPPPASLPAGLSRHDALDTQPTRVPTAATLQRPRTPPAPLTSVAPERPVPNAEETELRPHGVEPARVAVGATLKGRFVLEEILGRGGMGVVYKARDLRREEAQDREPYVAIKVLAADFRVHPDSFIALQREAKKAQKLAHPNIVTVYDFDRDGDTVFMTMEYLEGESLDKLIKRTSPHGLPTPEALSLIRGMAAGLAYAHEQHIVHADFKPANVFVTKAGTAKILDFGIARAAKRPEQPVQDVTVFDPAALGALTPAYASCEMLEDQDPDPRDDLYGLACVAYELLAGHHPFKRVPATQARDNGLHAQPIKTLTRGPWQGLLHGLAFSREDRIASAEQFLEEVVPGMRPGPRRWVLGVIGGGVATAFTLFFLSAYLVYKVPARVEVPGPAPVPTLPDSAPDEQSRPDVPFKPSIRVPIEELAPNVRAEVTRLLEVAEVHLLVGRLTEPRGSNAYEAYLRVLELHPGNEAASNGLQSIADAYEELARSSLESGDLPESRKLVEAGLGVRPNHSGLLALREQIGNE